MVRALAAGMGPRQVVETVLKMHPSLAGIDQVDPNDPMQLPGLQVNKN